MSNEADTAAPAPQATRSLSAQTAIGAAWLVGWRMVSRVLGLASTLILARLLAPNDFGVVAMAATFAGAVDALSELGLQDALVRRVSEGRELYNTAFTLQLGRALLTSLVIALAAPGASLWFNEPRLAPILFVLAAVSFMSGLENIGIIEFRRAMRFEMQVRLLVVPRLIGFAATISLAILLQNYWALIVGIAVSRVARTVMTYVVHPYRPSLGLAGWRELAGFSFWTWATCLAALVWERIDPFILGPLVGSAQLGVYLLALEIAILPISELVAPAADSLFAGFSAAQKRGQSSAHHAPLVIAVLIMCIMPLIITISCASGYVVAALLGPKWTDASALIAILAWLCLFNPVSYVCNAVLVSHNFVQRTFIARVIASAVKLAVLLVVTSQTSRLDIIAAAVTLCVSVECCAYLVLLNGIGMSALKTMAGSIGRTVMAGGGVVAILYEAGLAWNEVTLPSLLAFLQGAAIGALTLALYLALLTTIWFLCGRPVGAETRVVELSADHLRAALTRIRR